MIYDILGKYFHFLYPARPVLPDTAHNPVAASPKCIVTWSYCTAPHKAGRDVLYQKVKIGLRSTSLIQVKNKSLTNWDKVVKKSWMNHKKEYTIFMNILWASQDHVTSHEHKTSHEKVVNKSSASHEQIVKMSWASHD